MDLLATLGLQDDLPEQSTRLSHPGVIATFNNIEEKNNDVRLGFNMCCNCGTKLRVPAEDQDGEKETKPKKPSSKKNHNIVTCKGCNRVKYCSSACLKADADSTPRIDNVDDAQDEAACGHSPVICALLRLCNEDEDAEDEFFNDDDNAGSRKIKSNFQNINPKEEQTKEAAKYRVQTERESYPATLFNLLAESPHWFVDGMTRRLQSMESPIKVRRGKRDRESHSPKKPGQRKSELVLHIVGASVDSELWGWDGSEFNSSGKKTDEASVMEAYAEASTNLLSFLKQFPILLDSIRLVFVGPDCPRPKTNTGHKTHCHCEVPIPDSNTALVVETHCCNYGENKKQGSTSSLPPPDAIIFFNPGFSCPDYDWSQALSTASSSKASSFSSGGTPFLITTNTEMEGFADIKHMLDGGFISSSSLPQEILEAVEDDDAKQPSNTHGEFEEMHFFLNENPYAGLRVRQSGTMANDLYVKNRWILGGLFTSGGTSGIKRKKTERTSSSVDVGGDKKRKKARTGGEGGGGNTKNKNPALI